MRHVLINESRKWPVAQACQFDITRPELLRDIFPPTDADREPAVGTPGAERRPILKVNNIYGIYRAVQSGLGIGSLPNYMGQETSDLIRVLPELSGPTVEAYFVYPEELRPSKRIAVFRDFLIRKVTDGRGG